VKTSAPTHGSYDSGKLFSDSICGITGIPKGALEEDTNHKTSLSASIRDWSAEADLWEHSRVTNPWWD